MRTWYLTFAVGLIIVLSSCEFISYADWAMPPYTGDMTWNLVQEDAGFSNRVDHAAASFDGKLWVLGGYDAGSFSRDTYMEDVWSSTDGVTWERVTEEAPWHGRRGHSVVTFKGAMYLIGGYEVEEATGYRQFSNDIWRTYDGITWTEVTDNAPWPERYEHSVVQAYHNADDYLYLVGGSAMIETAKAKYSMVYYSDVWRSLDGETWAELPSNDYGGRSSQGAVVDPLTNRIYVHGGLHTISFDDSTDGEYDALPSKEWKDLWYTDDGTVWNSISTPSILRANHQMMYHADRIWFLPGRHTSNETYVYHSEQHYVSYTFDGVDWVNDSQGPGVGLRHSYASVLHDGKVWMIGGTTGDDGPDNDVWNGAVE